MILSDKSPLIIGKLNLGRGVFMAPMAGVSDSPVRRLAKQFGADVVCSEMIPAKGLAMVKRNIARDRILTYVRHHKEEKPFCAQLFGREPETFTKAAGMLMDAGADFIDINLGCPVKKVVNSGSGSALLKDPPLIGRIVKAARAAGDFPLTVKMRLGWDDDSINFIEVAKIARDAGADGVVLHARTRARMFSGQADWDAIAQLVDAMDIPVIGNGDVRSAQDAVAMFEKTGCAGIMIGRAAMGRPWIFAQVKAALANQPIPPRPKPMEMLEIFKNHFQMLTEEKGEKRAFLEIRKHIISYTRGLPGAVELRRHLFQYKDPRMVISETSGFFENVAKELQGNVQAS